MTYALASARLSRTGCAGYVLKVLTGGGSCRSVHAPMMVTTSLRLWGYFAGEIAASLP